MPQIFYTDAEYQSLKHQNHLLQAQVEVLEALRPQWAQGFTSDSVAAQTTSAALSQIWSRLAVANQTECIQKLEQLLLKV